MAISVFDPHAGSRKEILRGIHQAASKHIGCKCSSCGSHDYTELRGSLVCSYCRTPAMSTGRTAGDNPVSHALSNYLNSYAAISRRIG